MVRADEGSDFRFYLAYHHREIARQLFALTLHNEVQVRMATLPKYSGKHGMDAQRPMNAAHARRFLPLALATALAAILGLPLALQMQAEHTRHWRQASFEDFSRGTAKGVALRSDGRLELAPHFASFTDADCAYLWALRLDSKGNLYIAGGSNAKVLRVDSAGKATRVFESGELTAQAIAIDARDNLYVGTSPDGKVYKITPSGETNVFFEPKTKYIWDLLIDPRGTLYVATGDKGQIFAVAPDGTSELFYSGEETHIRALALDSRGNVIAGTDPNGLILRVPAGHSPATAKKAGTNHDKTAVEAAPKSLQNRSEPNNRQQASATEQKSNPRKAFVLYETSKKEIPARVSDNAGNIYAAAIGEKQKASGAITPSLIFHPPPINTATTTGGLAIITAPIPQPTIFSPFPPAVSSAVFRVAPDGAPEEIWNSRDSLAYALGVSSRGKLLLGTGNDGAVIEIESPGVFANFAKTGSAQVTSFAQSPSGKMYLSTANPGKVFTLGPDYEAEGSFESQTFDARMFSEWGRLEWFGDGAARSTTLKTEAPSKNDTARIALYARSGNTSDPGKDWSPWAGPYTVSGAKVECPPARFIQWKAQLKGQLNDGINWISIAYLPKNVAPVIDAIVLQNPGVRIQNPSLNPTPLPPSAQVKMPPQTNPLGGITVPSAPLQGDRDAPKFEPTPQGTQQKGFQSVVWSAHDDNDDELTYSLYYRGEGERDWKVLKDKIDQKYFSWDTSSLPDGAYYLKLLASDAPSNPRLEALKAERESERFEIDNTPPVIEGFSAQPPAGRDSSPTRIHFEARDRASTIARAEFSVDGGEWMLVPPIGRLSDAPRESYDLALPGLSTGEHTVAGRVVDRFENTSSSKTTFRISPAKP